MPTPNSRRAGLSFPLFFHIRLLFTAAAGDEILRACRLVVDTGMHALGWTRDEAVAFMLAHTPLSEVDVRSEVDRYIALPGQALAYKTGELRIHAARARAHARLGAKFDLRAFHDAVLANGALPLNELDRQVRRNHVVAYVVLVHVFVRVDIPCAGGGCTCPARVPIMVSHMTSLVHSHSPQINIWASGFR